MCVLFYFSSVCRHVCANAFNYKVHCGSAFEPGASGLPYSCTPPVCVPAVIGGLTVWRHNNNKKIDKTTSVSLITLVVTVTSVLLLYHVGKECYNSSTTHPSQLAYTFNELQKRKRKRNIGGGKKGQKTRPHKHYNKTRQRTKYKSEYKSLQSYMHNQHTSESLQKNNLFKTTSTS